MRLLTHIRTLIQHLEQSPLSPFQATTLIASAIFLRIFFENFTNAGNAGVANGFLDTFFHYPLWYGCLFLSAMFILSVFARMSVALARTTIAFSSFVLLTPPLIDSVVHGLGGHVYGYLAGDAITMTFHFFTLMLFSSAVGIGIKLELLAALLAAFLSVRLRTVSVLRGLGAAFAFYVVAFMFLSLPVWMSASWRIAFPNDTLAREEVSLSKFFQEEEPARSLFWPRPMVLDVRESVGPVGLSNSDHFSITASLFLLVLFIALLATLYARARPAQWRALLGNLRYTRILQYLLLAGYGVYLGLSLQSGGFSLSFGDVLSFVGLFIGVLFAWLFAVWENDEEDRAIDAVSNKGRPLVSGVFEQGEWHELKWTFLTLSLIGSFLAGWYSFILILVFLVNYHLYSCPPLRLKRFPGISSLIVAGNALLVVLSGFYLAAGTELLYAFPAPAALGIFLVLLCAENIKNMKDIEGDRKAGIHTLPVLLGERGGPRAVGILGALAILVVPPLFGLSPFSLVLAGTSALAAYLLITRKPYRELPVFLLYLVFFIAFFALTLVDLA
ncbi:MAG: UbiA family prenyltransferase [Minisyncoccia bacterium]